MFILILNLHHFIWPTIQLSYSIFAWPPVPIFIVLRSVHTEQYLPCDAQCNVASALSRWVITAGLSHATATVACIEIGQNGALITHHSNLDVIAVE